MADSTPFTPPTIPRPQRPHMDPSYGIEDDKDGLLTWEWVSDQMAKSRNYWISTTRPDGRPHAMPVWGVWLDDTLFFGTGRGSRKARNLAANPAVVAHAESGDEVVIIEGVVEETTDLAILRRIARAYATKYPPFAPDPEPSPGSVTYAVRPRVVFAWLERDYPSTATRWRFEPT